MSVDVNQLLPPLQTTEPTAAAAAATTTQEKSRQLQREDGIRIPPADHPVPPPPPNQPNESSGGAGGRKRKRQGAGGSNWLPQNHFNNNKRQKNKQQNIIICGGGGGSGPGAGNLSLANAGGNNHNNSLGTVSSNSNSNNNNNNNNNNHKSNAENYGGRKNFYHKIHFRQLNGNRSRRLQLFPAALSKFFLPDKRPRKEIIVPPTKFLLGGNISDPLNLNSLQDDDVEASPKHSPMMTPPKVEVIIPPNIRDPLHLLDPVDSIEYEKQLTSPMKKMMMMGGNNLGKKGGRNNNKKKNRVGRNSFQKSQNNFQAVSATVTSSECLDGGAAGGSAIASGSIMAVDGEAVPGGGGKEEGQLLEGAESGTGSKDMEHRCREGALKLDLNQSGEGENELAGNQRKRRISETSSQACGKAKARRLDSIVSPVIPQPGAHKRPLPMGPQGAPHRNRMRTQSVQSQDNDDLGGKQHGEELDVVTAVKVEQKGEESEANRSTDSIKSNATAESARAGSDVASTSGTGAAAAAAGASKTAKEKEAKNKKKSSVFQFGNYDRYYGYRNLNEMMDVRLRVFQQNEFLFKDKDILDIGCNVGHLTTVVAKNFSPRSVLGLDIDAKLIRRAKQNASLFVRVPPVSTAAQVKVEQEKSTHRRRKRGKGSDKKFAEFFPQSFPLCYGLIPDVARMATSTVTSSSLSGTSAAASVGASQPSMTPKEGSSNDQTAMLLVKEEPVQVKEEEEEVAAEEDAAVAGSSTGEQQKKTPRPIKTEVTERSQFPNNIRFVSANYVLKSEQQLANDERHKYDLVLCLSVTKWVHLNYGDTGLKMMFRRIFNQLRPGGKLILEAQNWASYKKKKKLTERIFRNFQQIEFYPSQFHEYLLSPEVGFSHSYPLGVPRHLSKGFRRPIQLYVKGDYTPSQVMWSDAHHPPQTPYTPYRGIYAEMMCPPPRGYNMNSSAWGGGDNTPFRPMASTSQYYNPKETDSYLPSYETEVSTRRYCFQSPLYSAEWSPPPLSSSNSDTRTPPKQPSAWSVSTTPMTPSQAFGTQGSVTNTPHHRHVYPPDEPLLDLDNADSEDQPVNSNNNNNSGSGVAQSNNGVSSSGDTPRTEEDSPEH